MDSGNTVTDSLLIEKQRGITIRTSYVSFTNGDKTIQLLDTPGHIDFSSEVVRAINVLDVAILVISGVEGIEAQTKVIWDMLNKEKYQHLYLLISWIAWELLMKAHLIKFVYFLLKERYHLLI